MTLTWTAPAGASSYTYYINDAAVVPNSLTGTTTLTAVFSGLTVRPNKVVVNAYNAGGTLIAEGVVKNYLVTNYNFASPAAAANSLIQNPSSIAGWTATGTLTSNTQGVTGTYGNFVVANGTNGGYMYPCPYGTFFMCQFYGMASNSFTLTSATFTLYARTYTVSFVAATRGVFNTAQVMTVTLMGTSALGSVSTQTTFTASNTQYPWTPFSFTGTAPVTATNYYLLITWSTSNTADSMIGISQILVS
jgi:hypothetical protein